MSKYVGDDDISNGVTEAARGTFLYWGMGVPEEKTVVENLKSNLLHFQE
jgi:hypothetical protein